MDESSQNALAVAASAYLRSAAQQPVRWLPWGTEAFARAAAEDKPVLLDIGSVGCSWCRVMDRESYTHSALAEFINEHFVAVKVDRDERPDIDTRYQAAVNAISGQGGWPLTVFLTPDGRPYFGGTYFPAEERYGQPSFRRVLHMMAHSFYEQRAEVEESAASVMDAIEYGENYAGPAGDLRQRGAAMQLLDKLVGATLQQFDRQHGGFGSQPKFPHPAALDMLINRTLHGGSQAEEARHTVLTTLHAMARGGINDQLQGGFHRYSVDERWVVPKFEKTLYDNAALLQTYVRAAQAFGDAECRDTALTLLHWMTSTLFDNERGGFASMQLADADTDNEGRFYTWTRDEAAAVLTGPELRLAEAYFDLGPIGDLSNDPARNVLFRPLTQAAAASQAGVEFVDAERLLPGVRETLRTARAARPAPPIDRAMYTDWNGMAISAYVHASRVLDQPEALILAQRSLDRALTTVVAEGAVAHVMAYADGSQPATHTIGLLDDHVLLAHACMDMWDATGMESYLRAAEQIADVLQRRFHDSDRGGFFDSARNGTEALGALAARRRPVQDAPTPAGNPATASLLLRLYQATGDEALREAALVTLESFAAVVEHLGLYAATFGLALARLAAYEQPSAAKVQSAQTSTDA